MSLKKRRFTLRKGLINLLTVFFLITSGLILKEAVGEVMRSSKTKEDLVLIEKEIKTLEEENKELESLKVKLNDSNYVQNYARGKHLMSKSEEQVFSLPKAKE